MCKARSVRDELENKKKKNYIVTREKMPVCQCNSKGGSKGRLWTNFAVIVFTLRMARRKQTDGFAI